MTMYESGRWHELSGSSSRAPGEGCGMIALTVAVVVLGMTVATIAFLATILL